jgi:DNA ligase 1
VKQAIRFWAIESDCDGFLVTHGHLNGAEIQEYTNVPCGLAGRTQEAQIQSEVQSKFNKQLQRGYKTTISEAEEQVGGGLNEAGMPRPMLATPEKNVKDDVSGYFHQPKLNGHRCLMESHYGDVRACSRNGKEIDSVTEIFMEMSMMFPDDHVITDGELYCHGIPLEDIGSWVKRRQQNTLQLEYWVYDVVIPGLSFSARNAFLIEAFNKNKHTRRRLRYCPTGRGVLDKKELLEGYRTMKYEGAILRNPSGLYETGKRSKSLVKVKHLEDDEFLVVSITPSKDGWAILGCVSKSGKHFTVSAPGTHHEKTEVMENKEKYIGKHIQVEYAELTKAGVPFHPVATFWRDKDGE